MGAGTKEGFSPYLLHQTFFQSQDPRGLRIRTLASIRVGSGHIHTWGMWTKLGAEIVNELSLAAPGHRECREWLCSGGRWVRVVWGRCV